MRQATGRALLAVPALVVVGCSGSPSGEDEPTVDGPGVDVGDVEAVELVEARGAVHLRVSGSLTGTDMPHRGELSLGADECVYPQQEGEQRRLVALEDGTTEDVTINAEGVHVTDQSFDWGDDIEFRRVWHEDLAVDDVAAETPCTEADMIIVISAPGELDLTA